MIDSCHGGFISGTRPAAVDDTSACGSSLVSTGVNSVGVLTLYEVPEM